MEDLLKLHEQRQELRKRLTEKSSILKNVLVTLASSEEALCSSKQAWSAANEEVLRLRSKKDGFQSEISVATSGLDGESIRGNELGTKKLVLELELEKKTADVSALNGRHQYLDSTLHIVREDIKSVDEQIVDEKRLVHELKTRVSNYEVKTKLMIAEIVQLEGKLVVQTQVCVAMTDASNLICVERETAFRELTIAQDLIQRQITKAGDVSNEISDNQSRLCVLQQQRHELDKGKILPLEKRIKYLQLSVNQREVNSTAAQMGSDSLDLTVTSLRLEYKARMASVTVNKRELSEVKLSHSHACKQLSAGKKALADTNVMLENIRTSNKSLEKQLNEKKELLNAESQSNEELVTTIARMRELLSQQSKQLIGCRDQMRATDETIGSLKTDIVNVDRELVREHSIRKTYEGVNQQTRDAIAAMCSQKNVLERQVEVKQCDNSSLEEFARRNEEKKKDLNIFLQTANGACNVVSAKIFTRQAQIEKLEYLVAEKKRIGTSIKSEQSKKLAQVIQTKKQLAELVERLNELRHSITVQISYREQITGIQKLIDEETLRVRALEVQHKVNVCRNIHPWSFMAVTEPPQFAQLQHLHQLQRNVETKQYQLVIVCREILEKEKLLEEILKVKNRESRLVLKRKLAQLIKNYKAQKYETRFLEDKISVARAREQENSL